MLQNIFIPTTSETIQKFYSVLALISKSSISGWCVVVPVLEQEKKKFLLVLETWNDEVSIFPAYTHTHTHMYLTYSDGTGTE